MLDRIVKGIAEFADEGHLHDVAVESVDAADVIHEAPRSRGIAT
jgi:hypothetical protein